MIMERCLSQLSSAAREVERAFDLGRFHCAPKIYFEFNDMLKMRAAEFKIVSSMSKSMFVACNGNPVRKIDSDAVEIQYGGIGIVLRCKVRAYAPAKTDAGYNDVLFIDKDILTP